MPALDSRSPFPGRGFVGEAWPPSPQGLSVPLPGLCHSWEVSQPDGPPLTGARSRWHRARPGGSVIRGLCPLDWGSPLVRKPGSAQSGRRPRTLEFRGPPKPEVSLAPSPREPQDPGLQGTLGLLQEEKLRSARPPDPRPVPAPACPGRPCSEVWVQDTPRITGVRAPCSLQGAGSQRGVTSYKAQEMMAVLAFG